MPLILSPGATDSIGVVFAPTDSGQAEGTLTIASNDADDPEKDLRLSGTGLLLNRAQSGLCYAASFGGFFGERTTLFSLDLASGVATEIGELGLLLVRGLAIDTAGVMFAATGNALYYVDSVTGQTSLATRTDLSQIDQVAFAPDNTLYAMAGRVLYTLSPGTGESHRIDDTGLFSSGLAFDPFDDSLWGIGSNRLYQIDPETAGVTLVAILNTQEQIDDIHFDNDGTLFGLQRAISSSGEDALVTIDKQTGALATVGSIGRSDLARIAFKTETFPGPQLALSTPGLNLGTVAVGDRGLPTPVILRSVGDEDIIISEINLPDSSFVLNLVSDLPITLAPGQQQRVEVFLAPKTDGELNATITVSSNDTNEPTKNLLLRGTGVQVALAQPGVCYGSIGRNNRDNNAGSLISIDPATGAGTLIGATGVTALPGLAVNSNGVLFGVDLDGEVYIIDAATGQATLAFDTRFFNIRALAFDEAGRLYGAASNALLRFDPATGRITVIGQTEVALRGLAFDPIDGSLWGSSGGFGVAGIYRINVETAEATLVGEVGLGEGVPDIHFDSEGNLFGAMGGGRSSNNQLVAIDKVTGAGSVIGDIGFSSVSGLTFLAQALAGPHIAVSPPRLDFGVVLLDSTSVARTVSIRSVGDDTVVVNNVAVSHPAFVVTDLPDLPVAISPGQNFAMKVHFAPAEASVLEEVLNISSSDADQPNREVRLNGEGFKLNIAETGVCYASASRSGINMGRLLKIDPNTGAGSLIGPTGLEGLAGLAINSEGVTYGIDQQSNDLYFIDVKSGRAVLAAETDLQLNAIAFDPDDVLYGVTRQRLYIIDPKTGEATEEASLDHEFGGLAFDPFDGTLYASRVGFFFGGDDEIFRVDTQTGESTIIGSTGFNDFVFDMHFDAEGNLFGITRESGSSEKILIAIDRLNGNAVKIGPTGFVELSDLAFRPHQLEGKRIGLNTRSIDFGVVIADSVRAQRQVIIRNVGTESVRISNIVTQAPFRVVLADTLPLDLAPGATDTISVVFEPVAGGVFNGNLAINSDDLAKPERLISLTGNGFSLAPAAAGVCYAAHPTTFGAELLTIDPLTDSGTRIDAFDDLIFDIDILTSGFMIGLRSRDFYLIDAATARSTFLATSNERWDAMAASADDSVLSSSSDRYTSSIRARERAGALVQPAKDLIRLLSIHSTANCGQLFLISSICSTRSMPALPMSATQNWTAPWWDCMLIAKVRCLVCKAVGFRHGMRW